MAWDLGVDAGLLEVVAVGVADAGAFEFDKDFVGGGLLNFDVIADLEDAVWARVLDPADGLCVGDVGCHLCEFN